MKTIVIFAVVACLAVANANLTPVDLSQWFPHEMEGNQNPGVGAHSAPQWDISGDQSECLLQGTNTDPTAYLSDEIIDFSNGGKTFDGRFRVETTDDNDFIGFVLGYKIEKTNDPKTIGASLTQNEPFVIVHWKQANQSNDNLGFGKVGFEARMVEMVSGSTFNNNAFWQYVAEGTSTTSNGYKWTSLQRGSTLGNVGWSDQQEYKITFTLEATRLQVWVDGVKQIDVGPPAGMATFPVGRFGFYNHSQEKVLYKGFTQGPPVNAGGSPGDDDNVPCVAQVCDTKTYSGPGTYTSASTNNANSVKMCFE